MDPDGSSPLCQKVQYVQQMYSVHPQREQTETGGPHSPESCTLTGQEVKSGCEADPTDPPQKHASTRAHNLVVALVLNAPRLSSPCAPSYPLFSYSSSFFLPLSCAYPSKCVINTPTLCPQSVDAYAGLKGS